MSTTSWKMTIDLADLRKATEALFEHLEETGRTSFEIDEDYYWEIPEEHLYDVREDLDPQNLHIGQLSHDWERLRSIAAVETPPVGYALAWLAPILRILGERNVF